MLQAQAAIYNQNHKFVYDVAFQSSPEAGGTQLGEGVYTAPDNSWPGNIGDWSVAATYYRLLIES
jgi:hypothetical protein